MQQESRPTDREIREKIDVLNSTRDMRKDPKSEQGKAAWNQFHDALAWLVLHGAPMSFDGKNWIRED
ncbi:MAG: hypothetical protein E6J34_11920 [Chloroflexi bacterium]|nr:MAG: hypothetical protein E6J34_11920 [Chloroflexota bacterium]